jgi:hypothetical protein
MRSLVGPIAAAVMATMFVMPADARAKKPKRPAAVQTQQASPSLDGRTLGRMRTCGFDYLQYDGLGTPYVPTGAHGETLDVSLAPGRSRRGFRLGLFATARLLQSARDPPPPRPSLRDSGNRVDGRRARVRALLAK